ncbi:hypothetical protein BC936DRAFT_137674 [Jimgerdemannia flammicorona]|uniref:Mitochondrial inner membrane protease subunit 2 n=1 Tax=Jimgerdemannia flammicorona TaxID=994334 RepID=A0A433CWW0_9FUNG|nr:hypothetical protein BC936DRAFT_137674 [Jimgerdemannia flammicorona]
MAYSKLWSSPTTRTVLRTLTWIPVFLCLRGRQVHAGESAETPDSPFASVIGADVRRVYAAHVQSRLEHADARYRSAKPVVGGESPLSPRSPRNPDLIITKRIIALEGDTVKTLKPYPEKLVRIPKGHAWVEGDESFHSRDSNTFGAIPLGLVNAKVTFILWPLSRFGAVPRVTKSERVIYCYASRSSLAEEADQWS